MHKSTWHFDKIMKNVKKKKFKAMFRTLFDREYRRQIQHMINTVKARPVDCVDSNLRLLDIEYGHSINYPEWVVSLQKQIRNQGYMSLEPVKVIWDPTKDKYLIVDGNHRLAALNRELSAHQRIPVKLLIPSPIGKV